MYNTLLKKNFSRLKIVKGNLFELAEKGEFDVIAQGNNCFCQQGGGIAVEFVKRFNTLDFPMEKSGKGDESKLGKIDYRTFSLNDGNWEQDHKGSLTVVNTYTQFHYGKKFGPPIRYNAVLNVFKSMNREFKGKRIGLPAIGAGLAGGSLTKISEMMNDCFTDCDVTLVVLS